MQAPNLPYALAIIEGQEKGKCALDQRNESPYP